ncbi:MAG: PKD domain-containing protein [Spirochaetota bacterium]
MRKVLSHLCLLISITRLIIACKPPPEVVPNAPPIVQIEAGNVTVANGESAAFTAKAEDPDSDPLTYQWYVDDVPQEGAVDSVFTVSKSPPQDTTYTIKVTVNDGKDTAEASTAMSVVILTVMHLSNTGSFTYSPNLGSVPKDVYFVFTNPTQNDAASKPVVTSLSGTRSLSTVPPLKSSGYTTPAGTLSGIGFRGKPEISRFNAEAAAKLRRSSISRNLIVPLQPLFSDTFLQTDPFPDDPTLNAFSDDTSLNAVPATCQKVVSSISTAQEIRTLNIWVANDSFTTGGTKSKLVTQGMVNLLADKFLLAEPGNDIYDWVTNIYGPEWGAHDYSNLISPNNEITILLYDIDGDNSTTGGILGFFYAKDNFIKTSGSGTVTDISNQRIMFYLDAVLFATDDGVGGPWDITDPWPEEIVSTLAHEFQHMINFYQKAVLRGGGSSQTWLDEMASMVTEDFVSDKILTKGPRGVAYNDGTAGSPGNTNGRLPLYNSWNDIALIDWLPVTDVLKS